MSDLFTLYGAEAQYEASLEKARWPNGFQRPCCGGEEHCVLRGDSRNGFQCNACRHQTSFIADTAFPGPTLRFTVWCFGIYLISQVKTGLSALVLMQQLGISYLTAWLINHKSMQAMAEREESYVLEGNVQVDDAYLGGERSGGKVGRDSENKIPFVAAGSLSDQGSPCAPSSRQLVASR